MAYHWQQTYYNCPIKFHMFGQVIGPMNKLTRVDKHATGVILCLMIHGLHIVGNVIITQMLSSVESTSCVFLLPSPPLSPLPPSCPFPHPVSSPSSLLPCHSHALSIPFTPVHSIPRQSCIPLLPRPALNPSHLPTFSRPPLFLPRRRREDETVHPHCMKSAVRRDDLAHRSALTQESKQQVGKGQPSQDGTDSSEMAALPRWKATDVCCPSLRKDPVLGDCSVCERRRVEVVFVWLSVCLWWRLSSGQTFQTNLA